MIQLLAHDPTGMIYFTSDGENLTIHRPLESRPATWRAVAVAFTNHSFDVPPNGRMSFATEDDLADYLDIIFKEWHDAREF